MSLTTGKLKKLMLSIRLDTHGLRIKKKLSVFLIDRMLFVSLIKSENSHYQGQQHYVAVDLFGGEEGLKRTKQRDQEKLQLSKINGVDIIYFNYKENLTEKLVQNRLKNYLKEYE